jgi:hypothetical protein
MSTPLIAAASSFRKVISGKAEDIPWSGPLLAAVAVGLAAVVAYPLSGIAGVSRSLSAIGTGVLIAGASLLCGATVGFLFAIPRTLQGDERTGPKPTSLRSDYDFEVNTNLEQISDWLTKIIVGIGLVQLTKVPGSVAQLANFVSYAYSPPAPSGLITSIFLYFGACGFLMGYLWTRLFLTLEFSRADKAARNTPEFYEGIINAFLYQPPPKGFSNAIEGANYYLSRFGDNYRVYEYLACAYGQQYSFVKGAGDTDPQLLEEIQAKALEAVRKALQINPAEREMIRGLWDPSVAAPNQDDLTVFFEVPAFKELLEPK